MQLAWLLPAVRASFVVCIVFSDCSSTVSGMVPPAFGVLYAKGINGFSDIDPHQRRHDGDRTALWFFIIALISTCTIGLQDYMFGSAAATLTAKVRSLSFKAILRQDSKFWPYMYELVI
jgi:ATP-binding cassette subfamily B (MDR/TAP) protein 1